MQQDKQGLSAAEAAARLLQMGENRLVEGRKPNLAAMFFSQFKDVMIMILAVATVLSVMMGEGVEAVAIIIIVLLNAGMGFVQEYRTEKTLEALKELSAPSAHVRRGGVQQIINARGLVPGDIILLGAGDKIPADARLNDAVQLSCNESMLTGESHAVQKQADYALFMGCTVITGHGEATVTATGMHTEMGKIAGLMQSAEEEPTPLQLRLKQLGRFVAALCVTVCLAVGLLGYAQGGDFLTMLLTGVSLAVAAIPEGLPAIVTITLALSVNRILRRGAVIRKLHAVETLGCAGVICTDKTGTVTQNRMTIVEMQTPADTPQAQRYLLEAASLCTTAVLDKNGTGGMGDATELAILAAANKAGIVKTTLQRQWRIKDEMPFDAVRKRMSVTVQGSTGARLICKGAPDLLLPRCTRLHVKEGERLMTAQDRAALSSQISRMAEGALRVLGVAESTAPQKGETDLCFLGLLGMQDPPRPEVAPAVRKCRAAGIKPVMITGDNKETALAIARQVGIARAGDTVLEGTALDAMTDAQLTAVCMKTAVYARVSPAHKLRIVRAYKAAGQVCAMTGDGVNDAPAVKEADIGVAMGLSGTDVTREASGVIILDDNFATIIAAVEEGRVIYQNIRRFIRFLLTSNLGEVLGMLFGMLLGLPVMLLPIQILLVNLFTDGLPAIALGLEPPDEGILRHSPRPKSEGLFAHGLGRSIVVRGAMLGLASCGAYYAVLRMGNDLELARSACFLTIVLSQMLYIFECRGKGMRLGGNVPLLLAVGASVACTLLCVYMPAVQGVFTTQAVSGVYLIPVITAATAGTILAALWRVVRGPKAEQEG